MAIKKATIGGIGPFEYDDAVHQGAEFDTQIKINQVPSANEHVIRKSEVGGGGGVAPDNSQYIVVGLDADLANERRLQVEDGLSLTDGGANGDVTIGVTAQSSVGETVGFTAGVGAAVKDDSTFTGNSGATAYTIGDIVKHLKTLGILTA